MRTFSQSGWTTAETFKAYLLGLRNYYGWEDENTIHLLLDIFKAHTQSDVRELAESLNIKLYCIPAGLPDELQPLDIKIWGPMKTFARRLFRERFRYDPDKKRTKRMACEDMVRSWERLTPDVIQEAFHRLMYIERWQAGDVPNCKINLNRHHRAYVRASPEERKLMDLTEEYKAF